MKAMRLYLCGLVIVFLCGLAFLLFRTRPDQTPDLLVSPTSPVLLVSFVSPDNPTYLVFLNDEPVYWGHELGTFWIQAYPLRVGSNRVRALLDFPTAEASEYVPGSVLPRRADMTVKSILGGNELMVTNITVKDPFKSPVDLICSVNISEPVKFNGGDFDTLRPDDAQVISQARTIGFQIVNILRSNDSKSMKELLRTRHVERFNSFLTNWFAFPVEKLGQLIGSPRTESDLKVLIGKKLVLVYPSSPTNSIIAWKKSFNGGFATGNIDSLVFAKKHGKWGVIGEKGDWLELNPGSLPK